MKRWSLDARKEDQSGYSLFYLWERGGEGRNNRSTRARKDQTTLPFLLEWRPRKFFGARRYLFLCSGQGGLVNPQLRASNGGLLRPRVARAQGITRLR